MPRIAPKLSRLHINCGGNRSYSLRSSWQRNTDIKDQKITFKTNLSLTLSQTTMGTERGRRTGTTLWCNERLDVCNTVEASYHKESHFPWSFEKRLLFCENDKMKVKTSSLIKKSFYWNWAVTTSAVFRSQTDEHQNTWPHLYVNNAYWMISNFTVSVTVR